MKTSLFVTVFSIILFPGLNSFATSYGGIGSSDNLQPTAPSDIIIDPLGFVDYENLKILLQNLNDPDPFVKVEAIQALGEIQIKQSLVAVCDHLNDENIYVRAYAAEALGKIGLIDVSLTLSKLFPALDDPSPYVRAFVISALGELKNEKAIAPLRRMLHDKDKTIRGMAAWALEHIENSQ